MILRLSAILYFSLTIATAQSVEVTATGEFDIQNGPSRYIVGTEANGISIEFLPVTQTVDPSSSGFTKLALLQVRVTVAGSPLVDNSTVVPNFRINVSHQGRSGILTGYFVRSFENGKPGLILTPRISEFNLETFTLGGVTYSWTWEATQVIWEAGRPASPPMSFPVFVRATRAQIRFSPSPVQVTVPGGQNVIREVSVSMPPGVSLGQVNGDFLSATQTSAGTITLRASHSLETHGFSSTLLKFTAWGLPPAFLPVELALIPGTDFLRPSTKEISFVYVRGEAPPPAQNIPVQSSSPINFVPKSWDSGWMNPTVSSTGVTVTPQMTGKPPGKHRTRLLLGNASALVSEVFVNFAVVDDPGSVNVTIQPLLGGTVGVNPAAGPYLNGSRVTLTATPAPGFVFGRWLGAENDIDNPISVTVNGQTRITAEFLPVTGSCTYTLSSPKLHPADGYWDALLELQTQSGCPWTISEVPSWMRMQPMSGTGPATIRYFIASTSPPNVGFIRIADRYLMAYSSDCGFSRSSLAGGLPASGGTVSLVTRSRCSPFVSSRPWLRVPPWRGFVLSDMDREFPLQIDPNPGSQPRTASVNVGGIRVPAIQRAAEPAAPYTDVPAGHAFADHITILKVNNAADSCGPDSFCPEAPILREQMAELLVRSVLKADSFSFDPVPKFEDVPSNHPQFRWIQKLAELGITRGCTLTKFCPGDPVTRGQMAAFLVAARTRIPQGISPPEPNWFVDVERENIFGLYIDTVRRWGVTVGCYSNAFCPNDFTTRGQMAAFLVRAFFTP